MGERLRDNLSNVLRHAEVRLRVEGQMDDRDVPLKVIKAVYEAGTVCENELEAEYIGGVLASSRSGLASDDRAAILIALIGRLSLYQIRTHYIFYAAAQQVLANSETSLRYKFDRVSNAQFYLPGRVWGDAMALAKPEAAQWPAIRTHAMHGMRREHLIEQGYTYGSPSVLRRVTETLRSFPEAGFYFIISPLGIELFCSAHGFFLDPFETYLSPSSEFAHPEIEIEPGCALISSLRLTEEEVDSTLG